MRGTAAVLALVTAGGITGRWPEAAGADWLQFRGPGSAGIAPGEDPPLEWGAERNVVWKKRLPGAGASSPIVAGNRVFLTAYSGYGLDPKAAGEQSALKLHVLCHALDSGEELWRRDVSPQLPDEDYVQFLPEHGYASSTPAADSEAVYVFFGKSGVYAFSLDGKALWTASAGSGTHISGTGSSPLLHEDLVIINACSESNAVIAFNKRSGKEAWRARGIERSWCTPVLVEATGGRKEVVVNAEDAVIALDPQSGKELWRCAGIDDFVCPSVVAHGGIVYAIGGRKSVQSLAVRAGGSGNVTKTHVLWKSNQGSKVGSPVVHDGRLYWVQHTGIAYCLDAASGGLVYKARIQGLDRDKTYASAVLAGGRLYVVTCYGGTIVLAAQPEFRQLHQNDLGDESVFNASPAVVGGKLLLRSDRFLYCIGKVGE